MILALRLDPTQNRNNPPPPGPARAPPAAKKTNPEVYHLVLSDLGLPARDCLCFEDSQNGLRAAIGAGQPTIVTPSLYSAARISAARP